MNTFCIKMAFVILITSSLIIGYKENKEKLIQLRNRINILGE